MTLSFGTIRSIRYILNLCLQCFLTRILKFNQHGEDAFFSVNGQNIHHGLDDLIEFYRKSNTNLCTKLSNFVKKLPPPIETRKHGKKNLLHRAVTASNLDVVKEMLKTPERNLDAKDEHGMTACHLACKNKVNPEIMKLLIDRGANLNTRDKFGNTPLHVSRKNVNWPRVNHISFLFSTPAKVNAKKSWNNLLQPTKTWFSRETARPAMCKFLPASLFSDISKHYH